jgi:hypothetical protein
MVADTFLVHYKTHIAKNAANYSVTMAGSFFVLSQDHGPWLEDVSTDYNPQYYHCYSPDGHSLDEKICFTIDRGRYRPICQPVVCVDLLSILWIANCGAKVIRLIKWQDESGDKDYVISDKDGHFKLSAIKVKTKQ